MTLWHKNSVEIWLLVSSLALSCSFFAQGFSDFHPSTVKIKIKQNSSDGVYSSHGTGFFIAPDTVVTNFHVIADFKSSLEEDLVFNVVDPDHPQREGPEYLFSEITALSAIDDLAVLKTKNYTSPHYLRLAHDLDLELKNSTWLRASGFLADDFFHLRGIFENNHEVFSIRNTNHYGPKNGMSGSPVLAAGHSLVGVVSTATVRNTVSFIPLERLSELLAMEPLPSCTTKACIERELVYLKVKAESGDAKAQYRVGLWHWQGAAGLPSDHEGAIHWYQKAAKGGDPISQLDLGLIFLNSSHNYRQTQAHTWIHRAATEGWLSDAQHTLGDMHYFGKAGLEKNRTEAVKWYTMAAEDNHPESLYTLAAISEEKGDFEKALELYKKSSSQNKGIASLQLGKAYYYGALGVQKNCSEAIKYWEKGLKQGDSIPIKNEHVLYRRLSDLYSGEGELLNCPENPEKAEYYLIKSINSA